MMENVHVRFAGPDDADICAAFDQHTSAPLLRHKLQEGEILLAENEKGVIGYLRLDFLWGKIPFIGLILVSIGYRGQGVGKATLSCLERHLQTTGHASLYSSSQANEPEPQLWHRKMGFVECGKITAVNKGGIDEVFFRKEL